MTMEVDPVHDSQSLEQAEQPNGQSLDHEMVADSSKQQVSAQVSTHPEQSQQEPQDEADAAGKRTGATTAMLATASVPERVMAQMQKVVGMWAKTRPASLKQPAPSSAQPVTATAIASKLAVPSVSPSTTSLLPTLNTIKTNKDQSIKPSTQQTAKPSQTPGTSRPAECTSPVRSPSTVTAVASPVSGTTKTATPESQTGVRQRSAAFAAVQKMSASKTREAEIERIIKREERGILVPDVAADNPKKATTPPPPSATESSFQPSEDSDAETVGSQKKRSASEHSEHAKQTISRLLDRLQKPQVTRSSQSDTQVSGKKRPAASTVSTDGTQPAKRPRGRPKKNDSELKKKKQPDNTAPPAVIIINNQKVATDSTEPQQAASVATNTAGNKQTKESKSGTGAAMVSKNLKIKLAKKANPFLADSEGVNRPGNSSVSPTPADEGQTTVQQTPLPTPEAPQPSDVGGNTQKEQQAPVQSQSTAKQAAAESTAEKASKGSSTIPAAKDAFAKESSNKEQGSAAKEALNTQEGSTTAATPQLQQPRKTPGVTSHIKPKVARMTHDPFLTPASTTVPAAPKVRVDPFLTPAAVPSAQRQASVPQRQPSGVDTSQVQKAGQANNPVISNVAPTAGEPTNNEPKSSSTPLPSTDRPVTESVAIPVPSLPALPKQDVDPLCTATQYELMTNICQVLRWLGCGSQVNRQLWQRYRQHYVPGGDATLFELLAHYERLRDAVSYNSDDRQFITDALNDMFCLQL